MTIQEFEKQISGGGQYGLGQSRLAVFQGVNEDDDGRSYNFGVVRTDIRHIGQSSVIEVTVHFRAEGLQEIRDLRKLLLEEDESESGGTVPRPDRAVLFQFSTLSEKVGDGMILAAAPVSWSLMSDLPDAAPNAFRLIFDEAAYSFVSPSDLADEEADGEDEGTEAS